MKMAIRLIHVKIFVFALAYVSFTQESSLISEIRQYEGPTAVWWIGHNTWVIKSGDKVICTDLFLGGQRYEPAAVTAEELASILDISFVTHAHDDHFNAANSKVLVEQSNCLFVLPESCVPKARDIGIPENRMVVAQPRSEFQVLDIPVKTIRAIHGDDDFAIYYEANLEDVGYVITLDGKSFLQHGDTYLLEDHLFLEHVDVLFFSPTEHNMYIDRSVILINRLEPDYIFPQHHGTIDYTEETRFWAKGYPSEVKIRLSDALKKRYHILQPGDSMVIK